MKKILLIATMISSSIFATAQNDTSKTVRLKTFEVYKTEMGNKLHWTVSCFINFAVFEIQRSTDAVNYTTINTFQADILRCLQPFDYEDKNTKGKQYYRIRVGDRDGNFFTSKIVVITSGYTGFDIATMLPTLVTSTTTITISSAIISKAEIVIYNLQGTSAIKKSITLNKGTNDITIDCSTLAKGNYILATHNSEGEQKTIRLLKQ